MTSTPRLRPEPARPGRPVNTYEVDVAGLLDDHWTASLGVDSLVRHGHAPTPWTTLTVTVADQAQLHGVLARVRDLGVDLLSLTRTVGGVLGAPPDDVRID